MSKKLLRGPQIYSGFEPGGDDWDDDGEWDKVPGSGQLGYMASFEVWQETGYAKDIAEPFDGEPDWDDYVQWYKDCGFPGEPWKESEQP